MFILDIILDIHLMECLNSKGAQINIMIFS
jgi:hypothetical protein